MPYEIKRDGEKYCVYNKLTGENKGCSDSQEKAQAHMRALYANEKKETMDIVDILKELFETVVEKLGNIGGSKPRSELKDSDFVFASERKFPVVTAADVSDAVSSWGRYKGNHTFAEFKSRLIALCRRKGFIKALPKEWGVKETPETRIVIKQIGDSWHWVTISSTGFIDRDEEIVSSEALQKAVADAESMNYDLGYLTYWHEPTIRVGKCTSRFTEGVCLVETGTWFDDEISVACRKSIEENPDLWAVSIEFLGNLTTSVEHAVVKGATVKRLWNDISFKERDRSILPAWRASNTFSMVATKGGVEDMRVEKLAYLTEVAGEEAAKKIAQGVDAINKLAESDDAIVKEQTVIDSENTETEQSRESTSPAESAVIPASPLDALRAFAATLDEVKQKELAPIIIALAKAIEEDEPSGKPEAENPPDKTSYDRTANDETNKEDSTEAGKPATAPEGETDKQDTSKEQESTVAALTKEVADLKVELAEYKERDKEITALAGEVTTLKADLSGVGELAVQLREALVRQSREELPLGVLVRASESGDNVVTDKKEIESVRVKAADGNDPLSSMAQTIVNMLGGNQ